MSDIEFGIEWEDLDEFMQELDAMEKLADSIIMEEYGQYAMRLEEATKRLVHYKEGDLQDSINFDLPRLEMGQIVFRGGSNLVYALRRHEEPGRGPGTLAKPNFKGYRPGPKYLENAIKATADEFDETNDIILQRLLGEKR